MLALLGFQAQLDWWKVIRDDLKRSLVYRQEGNLEMPIMFVELRNVF